MYGCIRKRQLVVLSIIAWKTNHVNRAKQAVFHSLGQSYTCGMSACNTTKTSLDLATKPHHIFAYLLEKKVNPGAAFHMSLQTIWLYHPDLCSQYNIGLLWVRAWHGSHAAGGRKLGGCWRTTSFWRDFSQRPVFYSNSSSLHHIKSHLASRSCQLSKPTLLPCLFFLRLIYKNKTNSSWDQPVIDDWKASPV